MGKFHIHHLTGVLAQVGKLSIDNFWFLRAGINAIKLSIGVQTFRFGSI